jgi:putative copper export protein
VDTYDILPCARCPATPGRTRRIRRVLDKAMLPIDLDVIRVSLHVLAATIWVGGQIVLAVLVGPIRQTAPQALAPVARAFAWVAWPAFALLMLTGFWSMSASGLMLDPASRATILTKMALLVVSGAGAALHNYAKKPAIKGISAMVGLLAALAALVLGVAL